MSVASASTIRAMIAARPPDSPLVTVPDGSSWSSSSACEQFDTTDLQLTTARITQRDVIALVLPNGALSGLSLLSLLGSYACAPLNPRYTEAEYEFAFKDLHTSVLLSVPGFSPAAERAARSHGMALVEARLRPDAAGIELILREQGSVMARGLSNESGPQSEARTGSALLLHTSGTTARPKLVGLSERQLLHSARSVAGAIAIGEADCCLNVMPLFHIHGIVGALLASVVGGGSIFLTDGFDPFHFEGQLDASGCTWSTAVPSMYQAMLLRSRNRKDGRGMRSLRVMRSSSAPLPLSTAATLEARFGCHVINSYGMTEAAHQMASQPLEPLQRRVGTVGSSAGAEIAILCNGVVQRSAGGQGEVVVRGAGVIDHYLSPAPSNDATHVDGWFRTGDEGTLDTEGNLSLLGRLKEFINVAGEKVSPYEIEAALDQHPDVVQCVSFPVPDALRGERVCALAVVHPNGTGSADSATLRSFLRERLAAHKVPDKILLVDQLPVGPTGKLQRRLLADQLNLGTCCPDIDT